jgi:hypothetical protein
VPPPPAGERPAAGVTVAVPVAGPR